MQNIEIIIIKHHTPYIVHNTSYIIEHHHHPHPQHTSYIKHHTSKLKTAPPDCAHPSGFPPLDPGPPWRPAPTPPRAAQVRPGPDHANAAPTTHRAPTVGPPVRPIPKHWTGTLVQPLDFSELVNAAENGAHIVTGVC